MDCSHCGTSSRDEDEFCRKCGKSVQNSKYTSKISKLKVGWMVWWRADLPLVVTIVLLEWSVREDLVIEYLAYLCIIFPFSFFLLNWAGKLVARKKYGFDPLHARAKGFTILPIPAVGWGIWRIAIISTPLKGFLLGLSSAALTLGHIFLLLSLLSAYIFLMIIILGWATKRTVEPIKVSMK